MPPKKKKDLDSKTKEDDKIVLQSVGFEISRERKGLLLQSRKMAKWWHSFWKNHWNFREIEVHEFRSERSELFRPRSGQASDEVVIGRPSSCVILNKTKDKTWYSCDYVKEYVLSIFLISIDLHFETFCWQLESKLARSNTILFIIKAPCLGLNWFRQKF